MRIRVYNSDDIKLQGLAYYNDCYKYWDLNHCKEAFEQEYPNLIPKINGSFHNPNLKMAVIKFDEYEHDFKNYYQNLPNKVKRDIKISEKHKFYFKKFNFNNYLQDFCEINRSQNERRNVNPWYLNSPEFFKNSHSGYRHEWEDDLHYSQWYGLFKFLKHYRQGDVITNEKLFAYCKLAVEGELATIHLIWAHNNFLNKGIMFRLLTSVIEEAMKNKNIKCLVYHAYQQYPTWKSRMLFKPEPIEIIL
tara:strand:- start:96 stop:839 length:744 start_codon:yes stop_codon:yes gene_type:complete